MNTPSTWALCPEKRSETLRAAKFQSWEQTQQQGCSSPPSTTWTHYLQQTEVKNLQFPFCPSVGIWGTWEVTCIVGMTSSFSHDLWMGSSQLIFFFFLLFVTLPLFLPSYRTFGICSSTFSPVKSVTAYTYNLSVIWIGFTSLVICLVKWPKDGLEDWQVRKASKREEGVLSHRTMGNRRDHVHRVSLPSYTWSFPDVALRSSFLVLPRVLWVLSILPLMFHCLLTAYPYTLCFIALESTHTFCLIREHGTIF